MPALAEFLARRAGLVLEGLEDLASTVEREARDTVHILVERINIPYNSSSPPGLIEANTRDPWNKSGKYALGWVYFCIILLVFAALIRFYNLFTDKIRTALHHEEVLKSSTTSSPDTDYELSVLDTDKSTHKFFPRHGPLPEPTYPKAQSSVSSFAPLNNTIALFRWVFYRPLPVVRFGKRFTIVFPSLAVVVIVSAATIFVTLYCFLPQPLYWQSISYGSPPLAIRSGMIAVALMPWIIALSMKANLISFLTGIGHERLNVLHRWAAYLCLFLSLIHTIPFYITPAGDEEGLRTFKGYFSEQRFYIYGTGVAALVPLCVLCVHSLPSIRLRLYELFVASHVPIAIIYLGMLFWHCHNYLTSWHYLFSTVAIWFFSYIFRLFYLNWASPWRMSWLIGDEAAVTIMHENAIKVTIPTQTRWRPGQYIYLRMPGISVFENHPFTIASLCSEDFPSEYGEDYRDMVLVFRPFQGFTRKVLNSALEHGPWHTYRAFIDGPYGGMNRCIEAFDHVVLIAGGSGITAIVSQLLHLIKRMRDGKATTRSVQVVWALKRPEVMEWFKEELRICREYAPPETVQCQFYITTAKRQTHNGPLVSAQTPTRPVSLHFHDKVNDAFRTIADKRLSGGLSSKRNSAFIHAEAAGDPEREKELRRENEDAITALPQAHLVPSRSASTRHIQHAPPPPELKQPQPVRSILEKRQSPRNLAIDIASAVSAGNSALDPSLSAPGNDPTSQYFDQPHHPQQPQGFDFGFPQTPTDFQKNLMRFAFLPAAVKKTHDGWSTEYGRPDLPFMLRQMSGGWTGRRACVFVCGPPAMRVDVSRTVAEMQRKVWGEGGLEEVFLHAENYAI
ncbi:hypothetical protein H2201_003178 [Coniosporium apollinis]|uniref:ferric-chelate reductase (NADPH) n=1 Tax=Coniosporium apollinis TaxID=61459 RepID=A0ABQ9NWM5_9PEZI|nr:hypothetical protein H2201_003178 [Coniosporium apollinis]